MGVGILSPTEVREKLLQGQHQRLRRSPAADFDVDASAINLPLGGEYWEMKGSCRAGPDLYVEDLIRDHAQDSKAEVLHQDTVLRRNRVYVAKLNSWIHLSGIRTRGKATGKSSIGRLDVLVRLLGAKSTEFDRLPEIAEGDLYLEVTPISFDIIVSPGTCLNQLRLFRGHENMFTLSMGELDYEEQFPVVDKDGKELRLPDNRFDDTTYPFSLDLTQDAKSGRCGFVATADPPGPLDPTRDGYYDPHRFWQPVHLTDDVLLVEPDRLYILRSKERLRLPSHLAVECQAYTETLGEWRIEYAGFAHPWFGTSRKNGTPIIFEVRGHNVPTILRNGLHLGNVSFRRMSKPADEPEDQKYENQEQALAKCFKPWTK